MKVVIAALSALIGATAVVAHGQVEYVYKGGEQ